MKQDISTSSVVAPVALCRPQIVARMVKLLAFVRRVMAKKIRNYFTKPRKLARNGLFKDDLSKDQQKHGRFPVCIPISTLDA